MIHNTTIPWGSYGQVMSFYIQQLKHQQITWELKQKHVAFIQPASQHMPIGDAHFVFYDTQKSTLEPALAIKTADCVPIALVAPTKTGYVYTHIHSGWRGYTQGIVANTMSFLSQISNTNQIEVFIGPAIHGYSYPCDADVYMALQKHWQIYGTRINFESVCSSTIEYTNFTNKIANPRKACQLENCKYYIDIGVFAYTELQLWGVLAQNITIHPDNTFTSSCLPSYRRSTTTHKLDQNSRIYSVLHR
jgi:polyphenol oxidase